MRWAASLLLAAGVLEGTAGARPVLSAHAGVSGTGPTLDSAFDVPAGPDRYLVVGLSIPGNGPDVVSVSWAQTPLALIASQATPGGQCRSELWGLVGPATGAHTLTVTTSSALVVKGAVLAYDAVDPIVPAGGWQWATGATASAAVSLTTGGGEQVVDSLCVGGTGPSVGSASGGQTELWRASDGTLAAAGSDWPAAMGSTAMGWTVGTGATVGWAIAAMALRPSAAVVFLDAGPVPDAATARDASPPADGAAPPEVSAPPGPEPPLVEASVADERPAVDAPIDAPVDAPPPPADSATAEHADGAPAPRVAVAELRVGCACRVGRGGRPPAGLMVLAALAIARRARRR